jgi:integrase
MRGHIRKRGSRWAVVVDVGRDADGKRLRKWHSGYERRKDAERALTEILGRLQRGNYVAPSKLTLRAFIEDEWLPAVAVTLRPSTHESYAHNLCGHVLPAIGSMQLQRVTPAMLNALYAELATSREVDARKRAPLSARTIRYVHTIVHRALGDAVAWDRLARNPADRATPPTPKASAAPTMRTWSAQELRAFLEHVADDRLYAGWRLLAMTGMRRGELLGLRWRDLDLDAARASIVQTLIEGNGAPRLSTPKTDHGRRSVALDPVTVAALRAHRKRQAAERLAWGPAYQDDGLVCAREDGSPIWPRTFSRTFGRRAHDAELPTIRLHDLRHTHATLALQAGVHPKVVSERLGHANIGITLDTYSHAIPAMQEDAAARVAALLGD